MLTKKCPKCKEQLPVGKFYHNNGTKDGYSFYCKSCLSSITVCKILKEHAIDMRSDPERLTTAFLQRIIGISCKAGVK